MQRHETEPNIVPLNIHMQIGPAFKIASQTSFQYELGKSELVYLILEALILKIFSSMFVNLFLR